MDHRGSRLVMCLGWAQEGCDVGFPAPSWWIKFAMSEMVGILVAVAAVASSDCVGIACGSYCWQWLWRMY